MKQRKSRPETKPRIVARVEPEFHEQVSRFAEALDVNIQEFVVQALQTEMQGFDLRVQIKRLENRLEAQAKIKSDIVAERRSLRQALKEVASKLGVPDTAGHCVQRISEIEQELQTTADKLSIVKADRDAMKVERDDYKRARDAFKAKSEECESELLFVQAKLQGYRQQGFWGRLFRRVPEPVPYVEYVDD